MKYFEKYFSDVDFETGAEEVKVLCPFHNDTTPSATINVEKDLFHCWVCKEGYNEQQFIAKVNNISNLDAIKVLDKFKENQAQADWKLSEKAELWASEPFLQKVMGLGFSRELIDELDLGITKDDLGRLYLGIPVFYNKVLMDVRSYNLLKIDKVPKVRSKSGAQAGFVIPYDIWKNTTTTTYIMEGEKDMLLARELGINAITLTGGSGAKPNDFVKSSFSDKDIIICYDNDEAGISGAKKLYLSIRDVAKSIKYINIGDVCKENKEDFYDFITKYNKDIWDFYALETHDFDVEIKKEYTGIGKALNTNQIRKELISKVLVSAEFEDTYAIPSHVTVKKIAETGKDIMFEGEERTWALEEQNIQQALSLIEMDAKSNQVFSKIKEFLGIPSKEQGLKIMADNYATVYKTKVVDINSKAIDDNEKTVVLDLYSFTPLIVGNQYEIEYKVFPHPTKNQKLIAMAIKVKEIDGITDFKLNKALLEQLKTKGTIEQRLDYLYQSAKHHIAKHLDYNLWLMSDLVFNSILEFNYGEKIRGALDVFILGDTQIGKSETTSKLTDLYDFGHFLSLKTSTTVGLIGGSTSVGGAWLNTIGAIPRQNKKLVVLEEFSGAKPDFIKTMTDIRSSGRLRLARAAGELDVPCMLRTITISNPRNDDNGNPRHLATFPNGILPLMELIKSAEDVARYDAFFLMSKPTTTFNPFAYKLTGTKIPVEVYRHKINWVYTRKPENIIFENDTDSYIWQKASRDLNQGVVNKIFECNFPLFTTTTSLKLSRFCVALASLLVNTDESFENIIVTKEIVDYVVSWIINLYDNDIFKLKEYKEEYDSYNTLNDDEVRKIQPLYSKNSTMFEFLEHQQATSRNNLRSISGLDVDKFNYLFNSLVKLKLLRLSGETVFPTQRFRLAMAKIDKEFVNDIDNSMIGV